MKNFLRVFSSPEFNLYNALKYPKTQHKSTLTIFLDAEQQEYEIVAEKIHFTVAQAYVNYLQMKKKINCQLEKGK